MKASTIRELSENIITIQQVADGCGENKNVNMVDMAGHSFLPSDRVFARIEKAIKRPEIIENPEGYVKVFNENGLVVNKVEKISNWRSPVQQVIKQPGNWLFQFNPAKPFFIKKKQQYYCTRQLHSAFWRFEICV